MSRRDRRTPTEGLHAPTQHGHKAQQLLAWVQARGPSPGLQGDGPVQKTTAPALRPRGLGAELHQHHPSGKRGPLVKATKRGCWSARNSKAPSPSTWSHRPRRAGLLPPPATTLCPSFPAPTQIFNMSPREIPFCLPGAQVQHPHWAAPVGKSQTLLSPRFLFVTWEQK